jgi:hypothetical protein
MTIIIPLIRNLVKITIIAITVIMVIDNLGYNVTSVLAGLGIGGLAFALAAQDLLKNLFGGINYHNRQAIQAWTMGRHRRPAGRGHGDRNAKH